jgi:hypothetical protein
MIDISDEVLKAIRAVVDYNWNEEEDDFKQWDQDEHGLPEEGEAEPDPIDSGHIFGSLVQVNKWLEEHGE